LREYRSILWTVRLLVITRDNIVYAILIPPILKPLVTAAFEGFEQVQSAEFVVKTHPIWVISSIYTRSALDEGPVRAVVNNRHGRGVGQVGFVCRPVVIILNSTLERARRAGVLEVSIATVDAIHKEIVLLVPIDPHPGRIIAPKPAGVLREIRVVVVRLRVWTAQPRLIFRLAVHCSASFRAICSQLGVPLLAAVLRRRKQVLVAEGDFLGHEVLVVGAVNTVLLVDQVRKPLFRIVPRLSPPPILGLVGSVWSMLTCSWEVDWPRERGVAFAHSLGFSHAVCAAAIVLVAAFFGCAVDLELVRLVQHGLAEPTFLVGEPGTVPAWRTTCKWVCVDGLLTWRVALLVVVQTDAGGAVAAASPGIEDAPAAVGSYVVTPLRGVGRRALGRLTAWLRRRDRAGLSAWLLRRDRGRHIRWDY